MKKSSLPILLPILLMALTGIIYLQGAERRALRAVDQALAAGNPARAATLLASVADQRPGRWEMAGEYAFQAKDLPAAQAYLENARAAGELSADGYLLLGDVYRLRGETGAALAAWQAARENNAPALEVHRRALEVYRATGDFPAAIETLRAIVQLAPNDAQAHYQLGLLLAAHEPESALTYLAQAVELDETLSQAVILLQRSLRPTPETDDSAYALLNAGQALASLGEWELAAEAFARAVAANPAYAEAWAFLGEARNQLGQDGLPELDTALALDPESLAANMLYALEQRRRGNYSLALVYFHAAAALQPENPAIQVEIGATLNLLGDFHAALGYFQHAAELAPREPVYWHLLAQFAYQNNTLIAEVGLAAARQALLLNDDDPVALDLMGFGYYLLGDFPTAQRFLFRARELAPDDPRPWFHLGLVFLALGENQQAHAHLSRAISLDPASPTAEQALRVLTRYFP